MNQSQNELILNGARHFISLATESDMTSVLALQDIAFRKVLKQILGFIPPGKSPGERLQERWYRPEGAILVLKDEHCVIRASVFLQKMGTRSIGGSLTIDFKYQKPWVEGIAELMVQKVMDLSLEWDCSFVDSVTFPASVAHYKIYRNFGAPIFEALFLEKVLSDNVKHEQNLDFKFKKLSNENKIYQELLDGIKKVSGSIFDGLDLSADAQHVYERKIGETYLITQEDKVVAFAVTHFGPKSEAFTDDQLLIKYLCVDARIKNPENVFNYLMTTIEIEANAQGQKRIGAMVTSARRHCVNALLSLNYMTKELHSQWIMVPRYPNLQVENFALDCFNENQFVIAEWR